MHIEPGLVDAGKIWLSYATAAGTATYTLKLALDNIRERSLLSLILRSLTTTAFVFCFFEVLPHQPVGVSEVHLILGSTLFLLFGVAPAAIGLAAGLLTQGLFLFALSTLANRIIKPDTPYVELTYRQALALSTAYQAGIVTWVAFWAFYGQGFSAGNLLSVFSFGGAYMSVVIVEPLIDLAVLAIAKMTNRFSSSMLLERRLYQAL